MKKSQKIVICGIISLTLGGVIAPVSSVFADSIRDSSTTSAIKDTEKTVYLSNAQILEYLKEYSPGYYATLTSDEINSLKMSDFYRAARGVNKVTFGKSDFTIYINSDWANKIKAGGLVVAGALFGAIGFGAGSAVGAAAAGAAGAYIASKIDSLNTSRGVWFKFSYFGNQKGHGSQ